MEDFGLYLVMTNPVVGYERCCEAGCEKLYEGKGERR